MVLRGDHDRAITNECDRRFVLLLLLLLRTGKKQPQPGLSPLIGCGGNEHFEQSAVAVWRVASGIERTVIVFSAPGVTLSVAFRVQCLHCGSGRNEFTALLMYEPAVQWDRRGARAGFHGLVIS